MRSLHPADAVHKGFGTIPTSILQRKNGVCIYERPACRFVRSRYMAQKNGGHAFLRILRFSGFLNALGCGFYHDKLFFIHRI